MGFLDRFTGRKKPAAQEEAEAPSTAPAPVSAPSTSASEIVHDMPSDKFGPPSITASSLPATGALGSLGALGAGAATGGLGGLSAPSARLYDPYEGISSSVGKKPAAFRLPEQPEFVFEEEAGARKRGWAENLQFYTGVGYITGGAGGVVAGGYKFLTSKPEVQGPETMKLKANRILNSAGSFARPMGNACGILGLFFAVNESLLMNNVDLPMLPDSVHSVLAGALSGAMFRVPRGPRQMVIAAGVGAVGGVGIAGLRTFFPSL